MYSVCSLVIFLVHYRVALVLLRMDCNWYSLEWILQEELCVVILGEVGQGQMLFWGVGIALGNVNGQETALGWYRGRGTEVGGCYQGKSNSGWWYLGIALWWVVRGRGIAVDDSEACDETTLNAIENPSLKRSSPVGCIFDSHSVK